MLLWHPDGHERELENSQIAALEDAGMIHSDPDDSMSWIVNDDYSWDDILISLDEL